MTEFITENSILPNYMIFPRLLLDMELSETAKLLYVILLDRARLSVKKTDMRTIKGFLFIILFSVWPKIFTKAK